MSPGVKNHLSFDCSVTSTPLGCQMAPDAFGIAPLPLPGPHQVSGQAVVLHTAPPGPFVGAPPSVPHHRTGELLTPPPLKATAPAAFVVRTSAPTLSHIAPQPPSSQISVKFP